MPHETGTCSPEPGTCSPNPPQPGAPPRAGGALQSRIDGYWSTHARAYDSHQLSRLALEGERAAWEQVWQTALPREPAEVLDLGTGSGHVALLLAGLGHHVTGIDRAAGMLAEARRKAAALEHRPRFLIGDAVSPEFPPCSFDALTARYLLWTLQEPEAAARRWRRLLRPGGTIVVVDGLWMSPGNLAEPGDDVLSTRERHFREVYSAPALDALPLARARDIGATAQLLTASGFVDVVVDELPEILELDRRHGVAPGHRPIPQYRVSARRP